MSRESKKPLSRTPDAGCLLLPTVYCLLPQKKKQKTETETERENPTGSRKAGGINRFKVHSDQWVVFFQSRRDGAIYSAGC